MRVGDDFSREFPDGDPQTAEVMATLVRTGSALHDEIERAMVASFEAPQNVLNALAVIEGAEHPLTPSDVSERTLTSTATMTGTLDALERRGWIRRVPNPEDRRSLFIEITDDGQAVADRLLPGIRRLEKAMLSELTPSERTKLLALLAKVLKGTAAVAAAEPIPLDGRRQRTTRPT